MLFRNRATVLSAALLLAAPTAARCQTWTGPGTDWNTASNWSPQTVPNSPTAAISFTPAASGAVNISSSIQAQSLTFGNQFANMHYTLTSNPGAILSGVRTIAESDGYSGSAVVINLANVPTGSLLFPAGSDLAITNDTGFGGIYGGTLEIGASTVIGTSGSGGIVVSGSGQTTISGSFAGVSGGLTVAGGTTILRGDGGGLTVSYGGSLGFDYSTNTATKLGGGPLTVNCDTVSFYGWAAEKWVENC